MIRFTVKRIIKRIDTPNQIDERKIYGIVCAVSGIILNLLLFTVKLFAGSVSDSVAVTIDAFHNLTDIGSSGVTLLSFLLSEKDKAVKENIAGLIIGTILIFAGSELAQTSVIHISSPSTVRFSALSVFLLSFSVAVKVYMFLFNKKYGKKLDSAVLKAASADCLCDTLATLVTVSAVILSDICTANIDAYGGLAVSVFIFATGIKTVAECTKIIIDELIKQ